MVGPNILAKPVMVCPKCNEKYIIYKIREDKTERIILRTIHKCGIDHEHGKMLMSGE